MTGRTATPSLIALLQASPLGETDGAPEWVQPLPAGATVTTVDGRGPYRVEDAAKRAAESITAAGRLPVDENHSTNLAAPKGGPSHALGWMSELDARANGLWAKVEWTEEGKRLLADRTYRLVAPGHHPPQGRQDHADPPRRAHQLPPNLRGMAALNSETTMDVTKLARPSRVVAKFHSVREWGFKLKGNRAKQYQCIGGCVSSAKLHRFGEFKAQRGVPSDLASDPTHRPHGKNARLLGKESGDLESEKQLESPRW